MPSSGYYFVKLEITDGEHTYYSDEVVEIKGAEYTPDDVIHKNIVEQILKTWFQEDPEEAIPYEDTPENDKFWNLDQDAIVELDHYRKVTKAQFNILKDFIYHQELDLLKEKFQFR